jgi:ribosomal protein S18 acetylase RimI-like enzyme
MTCSIREARLEDYDALCLIFEQGDAHHRDALPRIFCSSDGPTRSWQYVAALIADENATILVAEDDNQVIGAIQALIREAPDIPIFVPRRYAVIDSIIVSQTYRRSGVGQALMEEAHLWALDKGATQVELNVWEFNQGALAFYERLGYSTASRKMFKSLE